MGDRLALFYGVGHGLFDVDIFATLQRREGDGSVPMIGRCNEHRIYVGALQHILMMGVCSCARELGGSHPDALLVNIAEGHDFNISLLLPVLSQEV
jgi:hypothetical protein